MRHWSGIGLGLIVSAAIAIPVPVIGQEQEGFRSARFHLTPAATDGLTLATPTTLAHLQWVAQVAFDYAHDPLVSSLPGGDEVAIIGNQVVMHAGFAIGLGDRYQARLVIPAAVVTSGDPADRSSIPFEEPDAGGLGDILVGAAVRLLGDPSVGFRLGVTADLSLPTGSTDAFVSDGGVGLRSTVQAAYALAPLTIAAEAGVALRPSRDFGSYRSGSQLLYRIGALIPMTDRVRGILELDGSTQLRDSQAFAEDSSPLEALGGVRFALTRELELGLAAGTQLSLAATSPALRMIASVGYRPGHRRSKPRPESMVAGELDSDGDGLADSVDACPKQAEDRDGYDDQDGCPDADNDADGVADSGDHCPDQAADRDLLSADGCPVADSDGDGIPDPEDGCENEPETENGYEDADGCPDASPVELARAYGLPPSIDFEAHGVQVASSSQEALEKLVEVMQGAPEITELRIIGHASDGEGDEDQRRRLAERRARAVLNWLVFHGLEPSRFAIAGEAAGGPMVEFEVVARSE